MGFAIHHMVTVVASLIMACVRGWRLALVMVALLPLIAVAGGILAKITTWGTSKQSEAFSKARGLSSQAVLHIRTVQSFQAEAGILQRFSKLLEGPRKVSVQLVTVGGVAAGFVNLCIFTTCAPPTAWPCASPAVCYRGGCCIRVISGISACCLLHHPLQAFWLPS